MCGTEIQAKRSFEALLNAAGHRADGWWVALNVPLRTDRGNAEVDLLIGIPNAGLLIVEVKGWRQFESDEEGRWRYKRDSIQSWVDVGSGPYIQAERQEYILLHQLFKLRERGVIGGGSLPRIGSCVLFGNVNSDVKISKQHEEFTLFRDTFCFSPSQSNLDAIQVLDRLVRILRSQAGGSREYENGTARIAEIQTVFSKVSSARGLNCFISESVARIEQLSQTAFSERSAIYEGGRLLVRGAAGTGKTVYALQLAINRAGTSGMPALYVCYSEHLANHIRESAWNSWGNLVITTPEELLVDLAGTESLKPFLDLEAEQQRSLSELYALLGEEPNKARARSYLDATKFGEQLIEAAAEAGARYSAVVVDEAQDFSDSLIDLFSLLVAPDGLFAAFVDPRQVTRRERGGAAWITPQSLRTATTQDLVKNYRNGDRIIDLVENEFSQLRYGRPVLGAPESIVDIREYSRASELPAVVQALIDELREADVHPSVLVSALGKEHLDELRRMGVNPVPVDDFKGLEDRAVVLVTGPSPNPLDPNREELYVGLTRANSYLGMVRRVRKPPIILKSTKGVSEKG